MLRFESQYPLDSSFLLNQILGGSSDGPSTWAPANNVGNLNLVSGTWLWPGQTLALASIGGVVQQMKDLLLCVSLFLYLSNKVKNSPVICCLREKYFTSKDAHRLKSKKMGKVIPCKQKPKVSMTAKLHSHHIWLIWSLDHYIVTVYVSFYTFCLRDKSALINKGSIQ